MELESFGVGVTCVMPGAVYDTCFASASNMSEALVWKFPIGSLTAASVASSVVRGLIAGCPELVIGWLNVICVNYIFALLPSRIVTWICSISWSPPPFSVKTRS